MRDGRRAGSGSRRASALLQGALLLLVGIAAGSASSLSGQQGPPVSQGPAPLPSAQEARERPLTLEDYTRHRRVSDVQAAPDGGRVAFVRTEMDPSGDRWRSAVWEAPVDGSRPARRLTVSDEGERSPRWSPDGRHLAFLSSRGEGDGSQIWVLPADGGEAIQVTRIPGGVSSFVWSPRGDRFAVVSTDTAESRPPVLEEGPEFDPEAPAPYVITRLQFLRDGSGYVGERRRRIHVADFREEGPPVDSTRLLTPGPWDSGSPAWSPDGRWIAFVSNRTEWPDANYQNDLWAVPAEGGEAVRLTEDPGSDGSPAWSPDGSRIAYLQTPPEPPVYASARLRTLEVEWRDGVPEAERISTHTEALDRPVRGTPVWGPGSRHVYFRIQDRGTEPLLRAHVEGAEEISPGGEEAREGVVEAILAPPSVVQGFSLAPEEGRVAAILSWGTRPGEVFSAPLEGVEAPVPLRDPDAHVASDGRPPARDLRNLSRANDSWLDEVTLTELRPLRWESADGTPVEGWVMVPEGGEPPHPLVVKIHGGPVAQYTWAYDFERQWWAAEGYAVLFTNPRGSSGYGEDFAHALWRDWGGPDYEDLMAAVDLLVEEGIADPDRMGVGGWSYGGILTNYVMVKTDRFRAGISGASETYYRPLYGTDDLQRWWEHELGLPWENRELYEEMSPLNRFTEIRTPLLLVSGEEDRRIPVGQSEMLYIRLKRVGVPTGLIVYPGQAHGIGRPSFQIDRLKRYREWFALHVLGDPDADPFFGELSW